MRHFLTVLYVLIFPAISFAQDAIPDTILLKDVVIYGLPVRDFYTGYRFETFDSSQIVRSRNLSVGEFLSRNTPIFFRSYGSDMASTVSFRGTGPSHTAVLWNGLNLNQPTLGQTDFSQIPVVTVDEISVQYGSAGSVFGSDAIGGSILLSAIPDWTRGFHINVSQEFTDYGRSCTTGGIQSAAGNTSFKTRFYLDHNRNRFAFKNITKAGSPVERQENAEVRKEGIVQDVFIKTGDKQQLSISGWYNESNRELQPVMSDPDSRDRLQEKNFRASCDYNSDLSFLSTDMRIGFLHDYYLFNGYDRTVSNQLTAQGEANKEFGRLHVLAGAKINHISAGADHFDRTIREDRSDLYASLQWKIGSLITMAASGRQQFVSGYYSPFAPSLGVNVTLFRNSLTAIHWTLQAAGGYRIPTFNDRYWTPGGNPSLKPEKSKNIETGINLQWLTEGYHIKLNAGFYHMRVKDWIVWIPSGPYWSPENIKKVHGTGSELSLSISKKFDKAHIGLDLAYSGSSTVDRSKTSAESGSYDKQLPYTPGQNATASLSLVWQSWNTFLDYGYTGVRYVTSDESSSLPGYQLINFGFGRQINLSGSNFSVYIRIDNLTNSDYQVMNLRAMPRRNFGITVAYSNN